MHRLFRLIVTITIFLLSTSNIYAQVLNLFQGFNFSNVAAGDSFAIEITNNSGFPVTFYPLTVFDSAGNYLFLDEQNYISYLNESGTQQGALRAHANVVKSPYFIDGRPPVFEYDNNNVYRPGIANKKYSFPQWFLNSCNYQCGEYAGMAGSILERSGLFTSGSIWGFNISNTHTLGECIIDGDTVLIDFDPDMPRFMDTLPDGTYMNAMDVFLHSEYFDSQNPYSVCYPDGICWQNDQRTSDEYAEFFSDSTIFSRYPTIDVQPDNMPGSWTLCRGCSMVFEWKVPDYVLDPNDSMTVALFDSVIYHIGVGITDTAAFGGLLQQLFGTATWQQAYDVFNQMNFIRTDELDDIINSSAFSYHSGKFKIKVPASPNGYSTDNIQFPFAINKIATSMGLTIDGINISAGQHTYKLWDEGGILDPDDDLSNVTADQFNYLKNVVIQPNDAVEFEVYYNQLLYRVFENFSADMFSVSSNFQVNTFPAQLITGTNVIAVDGPKVYPNPTKGILNVSVEGVLTDIAGRQMLALNKGHNDISHLKPGVYIFRSGNQSQKVIKH